MVAQSGEGPHCGRGNCSYPFFGIAFVMSGIDAFVRSTRRAINP